jgi:hypothetical protein
VSLEVIDCGIEEDKPESSDLTEFREEAVDLDRYPEDRFEDDPEARGSW